MPKTTGKIVFDRFHIMGHMGKTVDTISKREHRTRTGAEDAVLRGFNLGVGRAWAIKKSLCELRSYATAQQAEGFWRRWFCWAIHTRLEPVRAVAWPIKRH